MELHLLRFILAAFAIVWSVVIFIVVGRPSLKKKDPAVSYIRLPLTSETVYTFLELVFLFLSVTGTQTTVSASLLNEIARAVRLSMGILTYIFCIDHYRANGISTKGLIPIRLAIWITAVNYAVFAAGFFFPPAQSAIRIFTTIVLSATFLYTGIMAILAATEKKDFYLSSRAGFWGAVLCLSYYPFVGTADALSLTVSFLDSNRSAAIQLHPFIFSVILTISTVFIFKIKKSDERDFRKPIQPLSDREKDVAALMRKGQSNKQISHELGISLATVKTHVANILKKFNVASRAGLPFIIEEEETVQ